MTDRRRPLLLHVTTVPLSLWAFLRGQAPFMRGRGIDVHAASAPGPLLQKYAAHDDVPVHSIPMSRRITPVSDIVALARMVRLLRALRPDIVHAHTPKGGLIGMVAARLCRVPIRIYHIHGLPFATATGHRRRVLRATEWISCRCAHRVLCVSQSMRSLAISERLCPSGKIVVPGPGSISGVDAVERFDPDQFDEAGRADIRRSIDIHPTDLVVGFVGRLVRDKGIVDLALAWRSLTGERTDVRLVLVGDVEGEDRVPDDVISALRADTRVRMIPHVDDPAPYYAVMDLVVLPSYREGFPLVPLEAAAMRLPIVATNIPGCIDAEVDGTTGTLVTPGDVQQLAGAIRAYLDDPELRRRHGAAGRERVLCDFRPEAIWAAIEAEYRQLLT